MKLPFKFGSVSKKNFLSETIQDSEHRNFCPSGKRPTSGSLNNGLASFSKNSSSASVHGSQTLNAFAANVPPEMTAATTNENSIKQNQSSKPLKTSERRSDQDLEFKKYLQTTKASTGQRLKAAVSSYAESARKTFSKYKTRLDPATTIPENFAFGKFAKSQVSEDFLAGNYGGEPAAAQSEGEHASAGCAQTHDTRRAKSSRGCKKGPYTRERKARTTHKMRILAAKRRRHAKRRTTRSGKVLSRVPQNLEAWEDIKQNVRKPKDHGYDLKFDYNKILKPSFVENWLNDSVQPLVTALPLSVAQLGEGQIRYAVGFQQGLDDDANRECAHCRRDPTGASGLGNCDTCYYFLKSERIEFLKYGDAKNYKREFDAHASCPFMSADVEDSFASTGDSMLGICLMPILGTWEKMDRKIFRAKTRFRQFKEHVPVWSQKVRTAANSGYGLRSLQPTKCGPQPKTWGELLPQDFSPRYDEFWPKDFGPADYYKVSSTLHRPDVPKVTRVPKPPPATKKNHNAHREVKSGFKVEKYSSVVDAATQKVNFEIPEPNSAFDSPTESATISVPATTTAPATTTVPATATVPDVIDATALETISIEADSPLITNISQEEKTSFKDSGFNFFSGADATGNPNHEWASAEKEMEVHYSTRVSEPAAFLSEPQHINCSSEKISPILRPASTAGSDSTNCSVKDLELKVHVSTIEEVEVPEPAETRLNLSEIDPDEESDPHFSVYDCNSEEISVLVCMIPDDEKYIDSSTDVNSTIISCVDSEIPKTLNIFASVECEDLETGPVSKFIEATPTFSEPASISESPSLNSENFNVETSKLNQYFNSNSGDFQSERDVHKNEEVMNEIDEMLKGLGYSSAVGSFSNSETSQDYIKTIPPAELDSGSSESLHVPELYEMEQVQESSCQNSEDDVVEEFYTRNPDNNGNPNSMKNLTEALIAEIIDQYNKGKYDQPGNPNGAAEILGALLDEVFMGVQGFSEEFIESCKEEKHVSQEENDNVTSDQDDAYRFTVLTDSEDGSSVSDGIVPSEDLNASSNLTECDLPPLKELKLVKRATFSEKIDMELEICIEKEFRFEGQSLEDSQPILKQLKLVSRINSPLTSPIIAPLKALGAIVKQQHKNIIKPCLRPVVYVSKNTPSFLGEIENVKSISSVLNEKLSISHFQSTLKQPKLFSTQEGKVSASEPKPLNEVSPIINKKMKTDPDYFEEKEEAVEKKSATNESLWIALSMNENFDRNAISGTNDNDEELDLVSIAKEQMPKMPELFEMANFANEDYECIDLGIKRTPKVHFKEDETIKEIQEYDNTFKPSEISRCSETSRVPSKGLLKTTKNNITNKMLLFKTFTQPLTESELKETEDEMWTKIGECKEISSTHQQITNIMELQDNFILFLEAFKISRENFSDVAKSQILEYTKWLAQIKASTGAALALVNGAGNRYTILIGFIDQAKMTEQSIKKVDEDIRDMFDLLATITDILDQIQEAILQLRFEFPGYVGALSKIVELATLSCEELLKAYAKFCLNNVNGSTDLANIHYCTGYEVFLEKTSFFSNNPGTDYEVKFATLLNNLQRSHDVVKVATTELEKRLQIIMMSTANCRFAAENKNLVNKRISQETAVSVRSSTSDISLGGKTLTNSSEDVHIVPTEVKTGSAKNKKKFSIPGWMKLKGIGKNKG